MRANSSTNVKYMEPQDVKPPEGIPSAPPAGTAGAVYALPRQAGSEMPIGRGARQAPAPPLPASAAAPRARPRPRRRRCWRGCRAARSVAGAGLRRTLTGLAACSCASQIVAGLTQRARPPRHDAGTELASTGLAPERRRLYKHRQWPMEFKRAAADQHSGLLVGHGPIAELCRDQKIRMTFSSRGYWYRWHRECGPNIRPAFLRSAPPPPP